MADASVSLDSLRGLRTAPSLMLGRRSKGKKMQSNLRLVVSIAKRMKTLEEIGQIFDVTRERIRQIEAKALRKLRHPNRNGVLKEYIKRVSSLV